jgi:hypothetical protein
VTRPNIARRFREESSPARPSGATASAPSTWPGYVTSRSQRFRERAMSGRRLLVRTTRGAVESGSRVVEPAEEPRDALRRRQSASTTRRTRRRSRRRKSAKQPSPSARRTRPVPAERAAALRSEYCSIEAAGCPDSRREAFGAEHLSSVAVEKSPERVFVSFALRRHREAPGARKSPIGEPSEKLSGRAGRDETR